MATTANKGNAAERCPVWITTISLGSDECLINCAGARTLANNGRSAFQCLD